LRSGGFIDRLSRRMRFSFNSTLAATTLGAPESEPSLMAWRHATSLSNGEEHFALEVILMKRNAIFMAAAALILLLAGGQRAALAQTDELQRYEVGAQFSSLSIDEGGTTRTEPGFGGRFTFNVTDNFALEAEGNFFPKDDLFSAFRTGGRAIEGLFGVKIGKRYEHFGIFAKARPGFISFSQGRTLLIPTGVTNDPFGAFQVRTERLTHFAADIGGVLEFYPTRRVFTRLDAGDTIIRYGQTNINTFTGPIEGPFTPLTLPIPGHTTHNFQFSAGVGFRF
jgi:hypothetical protein